MDHDDQTMAKLRERFEAAKHGPITVIPPQRREPGAIRSAILLAVIVGALAQAAGELWPGYRLVAIIGAMVLAELLVFGARRW